MRLVLCGNNRILCEALASMLQARGGVSASLIAQRTLILLRSARHAAAKPIWRAYLPEVPPA